MGCSASGDFPARAGKPLGGQEPRELLQAVHDVLRRNARCERRLLRNDSDSITSSCSSDSERRKDKAGKRSVSSTASSTPEDKKKSDTCAERSEVPAQKRIRL